jgi:hypothetical protein
MTINDYIGELEHELRRRPEVTVGEGVLEPRRLQQLEPTRYSHHSRLPGLPSDSRKPAEWRRPSQRSPKKTITR